MTECPICHSPVQGGPVDTGHGWVMRLFCTRRGCIGSLTMELETWLKEKSQALDH